MAEVELKKSHKKFGDDDELEVAATETNVSKGKYDLDSDEDSDDEAPEEGNAEAGKRELDNVLKMKENALKLEQKMIKESRKMKNEAFAKQQKEKRSRKEEKSKSAPSNEIIEELPAEFFDKLQQQAKTEISQKSMPTHIDFNDIDEHYSQELKTQLQKRKKKNLKKLRATTISKGSVKLSLLSNIKDDKTMAPKKEVSVMSSKDKWLKRKSLNRKK